MKEKRDLAGIDDRLPAHDGTGRFRDLLYPPLAEIASRNRVAWAVLFALVPLGGSFLSFSVGFLAVWALISLALLRFPFRIEPPDRFVVFSCLALFATLVLVELADRPVVAAAWLAVKLLFFLTPLFLVSRMRLTPAEKVLPPVFLGAAVGGTLILPVVLVEYLWFSHWRVSAFAGNPGPLSVVALLTAGLAALHLRADRAVAGNILAVLGAAGASFTVLMTGMRGAWPALPLILGVALWYRRAEIRGIWHASRPWQRGVALVLAALAVVFATDALLPPMLHRLTQILTDLSRLASQPEAPTTLALRMGMYSAAWNAIVERPWFGWGLDDLWGGISPYLDPDLFGEIAYSHLHNIFLTVGVGSGIVGIVALVAVLVAPVWTAWRWRAGPQGKDRLAFALILVAAFLIPGMTNIMFFHDILDAVWVLSVSTLCASVPTSRPAEEAQAIP